MGVRDLLRGRRRWPLLAGLALLNAGLVVGGYALYWQVVADDVGGAVLEWIAEARAAGYDVRHRDLRIGGFPWRIHAELAAPHLGHGDQSDGWIWEADALVLEMRPWRLEEPVVTSRGAHRVWLAQAGSWRLIEATLTSAAAQLHFGPLGLERVVVRATDLVAAEPGRPGRIVLGRLRTEVQADWRSSEPTLAFITLIEDATLPPHLTPALGERLARARVDIEIDGGLAGGPLAEALRAWRDDGGLVELRGLTLDWGPLHLAAAGSFALDGLLRPIGAATVEIGGYDAALADLVANGLVRQEDAAAARITLGILAEQGSEGLAHVPLSVQDGAVFLGAVAIARVFPLLAPRS